MKSEVRDGRLYIEGADGPLTLDIIRTLFIDVESLILRTHYALFDDDRDQSVTHHIVGEGRLVKDRLSIAGYCDIITDKIAVEICPPPNDDIARHWTATIGFLPFDWELGIEEQFYIQACVPQSVYSDAASACTFSRVEKISLNIRAGGLWVAEWDWFATPTQSVTWYLQPSERDRDGKVAKVQLSGFSCSIRAS